MPTIKLSGLYLTRHGRQVGIMRDRGADMFWRWVTTLGYYVTAEGKACRGKGECSQDLVVELSPEILRSHADATDSMMGGDA